MSFTLGNLPARVRDFHGDPLDNAFRVARGRSTQDSEEHGACCGGVAAGEMTKCSIPTITIVPEFDANTQFSLDTSRLIEQLEEARRHRCEAGHHRSGDVSVARQVARRFGQARPVRASAAGVCGLARSLRNARRGMSADRRTRARHRTRCVMARCLRHPPTTRLPRVECACCWPPTSAACARTSRWRARCPSTACISMRSTRAR